MKFPSLFCIIIAFLCIFRNHSPEAICKLYVNKAEHMLRLIYSFLLFPKYRNPRMPIINRTVHRSSSQTEPYEAAIKTDVGPSAPPMMPMVEAFVTLKEIPPNTSAISQPATNHNSSHAAQTDKAPKTNLQQRLLSGFFFCSMVDFLSAFFES